MVDVFIRKSKGSFETETQKRRPYEDGGRYWSYTPKAQETPATQKLEEARIPPCSLWRQHSSADTLISTFWLPG